MDVKVRALREHGNGYGESHRKAEGTEYVVTERVARSLAAQGLVELADDSRKLPELSKAELVRRAAAKGVEIGKKTTKAEIIEKIEAASA